MSKQVSTNAEFDFVCFALCNSYEFSSLSAHSVALSTSGRRGCFRSRDYGEMNIQSRSEGRISFSNGKRLGVSLEGIRWKISYQLATR